MHYVVLPHGANRPTSSEVRGYTGSLGASPLACGTTSSDMVDDYVHTIVSVATCGTYEEPGTVITSTIQQISTGEDFYGLDAQFATSYSHSTVGQTSSRTTSQIMGYEEFYGLGEQAFVERTEGMEADLLTLVLPDGPLCLACPKLYPQGGYDVYLVAEDGSGTLQAMPTKLDVTMGTGGIGAELDGTTAPLFLTKQASSLFYTDIDIKVKMGVHGEVSYVVLPDGDPPPTAFHIRNGTVAGALAGGVKAVVANTDTVMTVQGPGVLAADTEYDVYIVGEDAEDHEQGAVTRLDVKTNIPTEPPVTLETSVVMTNTNKDPMPYTATFQDPVKDLDPSKISIIGGTLVMNEPTCDGVVTAKITRGPASGRTRSRSSRPRTTETPSR